MNKLRIPEILLFVCIWLAFTYACGVYSHMHKLPMGVHQGAQCDRASLAQNFYYHGMRFMYPEVNENRCGDGIVSCEMPLSSYLAACLYKLFGYSEFWFRLLNFICLSSGLIALWALLRTRIHFLTATALVLLLQASPLLLFYGPNFIPDASSLGLAFIAWLLFFRLYIKHPWLPALNGSAYHILFIVALSLSVASKSTSVIQWLSMCIVFGCSFIPALGIQIANRKKLLVSLAASMVVPVLWYFWSKHLAANHNSNYFMMRIPISETWESYTTAWAVYIANWPPQVLEDPLIYIAVSLWIVTLFLVKHIQREIWLLAAVNTFGSLAFLFLMMEQFKYHDYYAICLYPVFGLNWLALGDAIRKIRSKFWYIKIAVLALILTALNFQFHSGSKNLRERYTEGNYWEQSHHRSADLDTFRHMIRKAGVLATDCVIAGYDPAPNDMLYLLHLRGHRMTREHNDDRYRYVLFSTNPQWLISNDSALSKRVSGFCRIELKAEFKYLQLYKLHR